MLEGASLDEANIFASSMADMVVYIVEGFDLGFPVLVVDFELFFYVFGQDFGEFPMLLCEAGRDNWERLVLR